MPPGERCLRGLPGAPRAASGTRRLKRPGTLTPPPTPPQCILQKEPNFLTTLFREKIILVIVGLR